MHSLRIVARVSCGVLFGLVFAAGARAQLAPPYLEYAAKFTCGVESAKEPDDVVAGVYASSINIHNPQARTAVSFVKKIVVALREGATPPQPVVLEGSLKPDLADRVDCAFIAKALRLTAPFYVEGFVVLEVPPTSAGAQPVLDVTAKYTARAATTGAGVSTQSVVPILSKSITS
jgi:hypothetical protein